MTTFQRCPGCDNNAINAMLNEPILVEFYHNETVENQAAKLKLAMGQVRERCGYQPYLSAELMFLEYKIEAAYERIREL